MAMWATETHGYLGGSREARGCFVRNGMDKKQFRNQKLGKQTSRRQALAKLKTKIAPHPQKPRSKREGT
jgi:hypothetical protein